MNEITNSHVGRSLVLFAASALAIACAAGPEGQVAEGTDAAHAEASEAIGAGHEDGHAEHDEHGDGDPDRVVLGEAAHRTAGIEVEEVGAGEGAALREIDVPGAVEFDPERVALVSPRTAGRIERLAAVEGDRVRAGQVVAHLFSPEFLTAQNDFAHAVHRARALAGTSEAERVNTLADAARRRLELLGASPEVFVRLERAAPPLDLLPLASPLDGSIVEAHALVGAAAEPGTPIFTVADLSVVNVTAEVPEAMLAALRIGQPAVVRPSAYPDLRIEGRVLRIRDVLDPETRTAEAVISVANPDRALRPGMFASVSLVAEAASDAPDGRVTVPASSIVTDGARRFVFLEVGPRTYERRAVEVAAGTGGEERVMIASSVRPGDRVVVRGAFALKSELGKTAFGGHHH